MYGNSGIKIECMHLYGSNFAYKKFTFKSFKTERHWQKKKFYYGNKNINSDDI